MDIIFTGTPTKREIIIYLKNKKYSLLNKIKLKRDIIIFSKEKKGYFSYTLKNKLEYKRICEFKFYTSRDVHFFLFKKKHFLRKLFLLLFYQSVFRVCNTNVLCLVYSNKKSENICRCLELLIVNSLILCKIEASCMFNLFMFDTKYKNLTKTNSIDILHSDPNCILKKYFDSNIYKSNFLIKNNSCNIVRSINDGINKKEKLFFNDVSDENTRKRKKPTINYKLSPLQMIEYDFFDKEIDEKKDLSFMSKNVSNVSKLRNTNLKRITETCKNPKFINIDLLSKKNDNQPKKVEFTFSKISKKHSRRTNENIEPVKRIKNNINEVFPLQEINKNLSNVKKINKDNYDTLLKKNTKLNAGYKNITVKYIDKLFINHIKTEKKREKKIRILDEEIEPDYHNLDQLFPIIKKSRYRNKKGRKNKHKEVVFIQNVDLRSCNLEENY